MTTSTFLPPRAGIGAALIRAALLLGCAGLPPGNAQAATSQEEDACRPDVFRLCASSIPSEDAIVACLNANLTSLGPACRAVMDPPSPPASTSTLRSRRTAVP